MFSAALKKGGHPGHVCYTIRRAAGATRTVFLRGKADARRPQARRALRRSGHPGRVCFTTGWAAGRNRTVFLRGKADARRPEARRKEEKKRGKYEV